MDTFCEQVWGCGGSAARDSLQKQKEWEKRAVTKEQDRKVFFISFYRTIAISYRLSVRLSVHLSVTLVYHDHIG